jgi:hypothetical protein
MQMHFVRNDDAITLTRNGPGRCLGSFKIDRTNKEIWDERKSGKAPNESPKKHYNVSVLKSNLQKAVRRHNSTAAHATLRQLALQDPVELTRRLPIIMCEDSQLCSPLFTECIWLMAAVSKGYQLNANDLHILHNALESMLEASGRYNLRVDVDDSELTIRDAVTEAFAIRIAFGGMKGDVRFLGFLERRYSSGTLPCVEPKIYDITPEPFCPQKHILPEAIDFHCFPKLLREIDGLTQDSVWWHWSSPNVRAFVGVGAEAEEAHEYKQRQLHKLEFSETLKAYAQQKIRWVKSTSTDVKLIQLSFDSFVLKC